MSKRDRSHGFALAALALIILGVVFATAFGALEQAQRQAYEQPKDQGPARVEAESYNGWRDPFPQWAMAIFAAGGTGIGIWTIVLLQRTIKATRKGNKINRRIGEAQVRAYLSFSRAEILIQRKGVFSKVVPRIDIVIANSGSSPAIGFRWGAKFVYAYEGCSFVPRGGLETADHNGQDIPANAPASRQWLEFDSASLWQPDIDAWKAGKLRVYVDIVTASVDVFGKPIKFNERFRADIPASPEALKSGRIVLVLGKGTVDAPNHVAEVIKTRLRNESLSAAMKGISELHATLTVADASGDNPQEPG